MIDGEAVIARNDGMPDFRALRSRSRSSEAVLYTFDLIELNGEDLRGPAADRPQEAARWPFKGRQRW